MLKCYEVPYLGVEHLSVKHKETRGININKTYSHHGSRTGSNWIYFYQNMYTIDFDEVFIYQGSKHVLSYNRRLLL